MMDRIYDKSAKGRDEIGTRKYQLAPKLRALLVLIDGMHSGQALVRKFGFLGLTEQVLSNLLQDGFIECIAAPAAATAARPSEAQAVTPVEQRGVQDGILEPDETQYQAVYNFYTHTIKSALGLRGFGMTLKVERCNCLEDFRALRSTYVEAVLKAQGEEMARSLRARLDQLLYLGGVAPQTQPPHA